MDASSVARPKLGGPQSFLGSCSPTTQFKFAAHSDGGCR
jgi:hypothetical protein